MKPPTVGLAGSFLAILFLLHTPIALAATKAEVSDMAKQFHTEKDKFEAATGQSTSALLDTMGSAKKEEYLKAAYKEKTDGKMISTVRTDFLVPSSPAFTVLGVTPEEISEPVTPRELATSLLNGMDANGNLQTGVAIDFTPYLISMGDKLSLQQYRKSWFTRVLARTQVSFATTKGASEDDKSVRTSLGLRIGLVDKGDRRGSNRLEQCFYDPKKIDASSRQAIQILQSKKLDFENAQFEDEERLANLSNADQDELDAILSNISTRTEELKGLVTEVQQAKFNNLISLERNWGECNAESMKYDWNATNVTLGLAGILVGDDGSLDKFKGEGYAVYLTAGYGFEGVAGLDQNAQILAHVRYRKNDRQPLNDGSGLFQEQNTLVLGTQLRIALGYEKENVVISETESKEVTGKPTVVLVFEGDYTRANILNEGVDKSYKFSGGVDFKVTEKMNIKLVIGGETGKKTNTDAAFVIGNLKWAF